MKNIIFDLGNVLLRFEPEEFLSKYYDNNTLEDLMVIIFCSEQWDMLDLGSISIEDIINVFNQEYPRYSKEMSFVLNNWTEMLSPMEDNIKLLYELKKMGYSLYILSNFHNDSFNIIKNKYQFFSLFNGGVISGFEHVTKPNIKIYDILLKRYGLNPGECLFIDDSFSNIEMANEIGIDGIHLKYGVSLEKELLRKGIIKR